MKQDDVRMLAVELPEDILKAKWAGDFNRADRLIDWYLRSDRVPEFMKKRLLVEREILEHLPEDYAYTLEEGLALMQQDIPDFTMEELETLIDERKVDWLYIDGTLRLAARFYQTLRDVNPDIARRAGVRQENYNAAEVIDVRDAAIADMKAKGCVAARIRLKASITVAPESFREGDVLVHLPIPKPQINMKNIRILRTFPSQGEGGCEVFIGSEDQPQRTVAFREHITENHPFEVEYEFEADAKYHDLTKPPEAGEAACGLEQAMASGMVRPEDLEEIPPHIRFTEAIKALRDELAGEETDPLILARRFYDYVTTKVVYSYSRQYFTHEQIPEYAALNLRGDCGIQALLFITLCRSAGIPARWQSGLYVEPDEAGMHDWAMFYVEPYGWLFADASFGGSAFRSGNTERWNHYFGNLDCFRMAANDAFQAGLIPEKQHSRRDPYDSQAGEIEYSDKGLYVKDTIRHQEVIEFTRLD